jgi:hypothetical protein
MPINRDTLPREEPFFWWGPAWTRREARSLGPLVECSMLSAHEAAILAVLFQYGASIFVVSLTSGAGKSTLLDAIIRSSGARRELIYLRGLYETFDFLDSADPYRTCLLVNEISPHLPIYLWGQGVRTALQASAVGYQLCATAHAADAGSLIHLFTSPPLSVPLPLVHQPKIVVSLRHRDAAKEAAASISSIAAITPGASPQATSVTVLAGHSDPDLTGRVDTAALASFLRQAGFEERGFFEAVDQFRRAVISSARDGEDEPALLDRKGAG